MKLSTIPDFTGARRLSWLALAITVGAWLVMALTQGPQVARTLGDTDDALRLVLVRDLLHGRGWFDQHLMRLQPPEGTYIHWSRLLDGALAAVLWLFSRVLPPAAAEYALRFVWPLLWVYPAVFSGLIIARSLGGRVAVFVCALLMAVDTQLYIQFRPGRIDHHNVQITMTLVSAACAMAGGGRRRWAIGSGLATALGLAVGIEALAFHALIGASFGLAAAFDSKRVRAAGAYGLTLAAASAGLFVLQTPPDRWSLSVCDAMGFNLVAGLAAAGLGLAAWSLWGAQRTPGPRLALLAVVGAAAATAYLALDPICLHGPFAAVDPRLRPIWFDRIQELRPWPKLVRLDPVAAMVSITMAVMGAAAASVLLVVSRRSSGVPTLLAAACVFLAAIAAAHAFRMQDYAFWFGVPTLAAAFGLAAEHWLGGLLLATVAASLVASPMAVALAEFGLARLAKPKLAHVALVNVASGPAEDCSDTKPYAPLAALPPGLVLADIDLGPFILAHTRDSVMAAPYHRMSWGILSAHDALDAPASEAEGRVRALKADYVVECMANASSLSPESLEADLRRGRIPSWLERLSRPGQTLQIFRVKPAG